MYKLSNNIIRNNNPSILYKNSYSFFDCIVKEIDDIFCYDIGLYEPSNYSLVCMNNTMPDTAENFVDYCSRYQSIGIYLHHIISDIYINDNIKKMFTNLSSVNFYRPIYFSNSSTRKSDICYGLPKNNIDIINKKRKEIAILSNPLTKNNSINLQKSIHDNGLECDLIENFHIFDIEEAYETLSGYKIIIDNYSYINLITAAYCGAKVMTASNNLITEAFITRLHSESNIYIKNLLSNFQIDTGLISYLEKQYDYEKFCKQFLYQLNNINRELFYI